MANSLQSITATDIIFAPVEAVWHAWADTSQLSTWFTSDAKHDFREGGAYENGDGDCGVYMRIEPNRVIQFTWDNPGHSPGTLVTVTFEGETDGTRLTITHDQLADDKCARDMKTGWTWAIASLKSMVETGAPVKHDDWVAQQAG